MQVKEALSLLPYEFQTVEKAALASGKLRLKWTDPLSFPYESLTRVAGASESSKRLNIGFSESARKIQAEFGAAFVVACGLSIAQSLEDRDQDIVSLHPARETMKKIGAWEYIQNESPEGALGKAFKEGPMSPVGLLNNLAQPASRAREWLGIWNDLLSNAPEGKEGQWVSYAALWAADWSAIYESSLYEQLEHPLAVRQYVSSVLPGLFRAFLKGPSVFLGDIVAGWVVSKNSFRAIDRYRKAIAAPEASYKAQLDEQIARRLSPMRAAFEVIQHDDKVGREHAQEGYVQWVRMNLYRLAESACVQSKVIYPHELLDLVFVEDLEQATDRVEKFASDSRFAPVKKDVEAFQAQLKKEAGLFGKKERVSKGAKFHAYWQACEYGIRKMAEFDPSASERFNILSDSNERLQQLAERGSAYVVGVGSVGLASVAGVGGEELPDEIQETPYIETEQTSKPVVKGQTGHLFLDMKDFTAKTAQYKERNIAEFMRWDFYEPLLRAAKKYYQGMAHLDDQGGIVVNNLLGDALSMSGDIASLVNFSVDARAIFGEYAGKLQDQEATERKLTALKSKRKDLVAAANSYAGEYKSLKAQYDADKSAETFTKLKDIRASHESAMRRIKLADQEIVETEKDQGAVPEYGIFLSFGPHAIHIPFEDDLFGNLFVAIGEKINESARGTARSGQLLRRLKTGLAGQPNADKLAFEVAVGKELVMDAEPEAEAEILNALEQGTQIQALPSGTGFVERDGIYNNGLALSADATSAYFAKQEGLKFAELQLNSAGEIADALAPYWWPGDRMKLVFLSDDSGLVQVVRYEGEVVFKGFEAEGSIGVFDLLTQEDEIFGVLAKLASQARPIDVQSAQSWVENRLK